MTRQLASLLARDGSLNNSEGTATGSENGTSPAKRPASWISL